MTKELGEQWVHCLARPEPFPDEIAHGYFARALRLNGYRCAPDFCRFLRGADEYAGEGNVKLRLRIDAILRSAACIAGIDVETFAARHSLAPLRFAVQFKSLGSWAAARYHGGCMLLPRGKLYGCPHCAQVDIAVFGTAYLRRIHQVPGIAYCSEHNCELVAEGVWPDVEGVTRLDREHAIRACLKPPHLSTLGPLSRYEAACRALLCRSRPIPWSLFKNGINALLHRRGLTLNTRKGGFKWPRLLTETYDSDWIQALNIWRSANSAPWARSSTYILAALVGALTNSVQDTQLFFDALDACNETSQTSSDEAELLDDLLCPA